MGNKLTNESDAYFVASLISKRSSLKISRSKQMLKKTVLLKSNVLSQSLSSCDRYQDITDFKELFFKDKTQN